MTATDDELLAELAGVLRQLTEPPAGLADQVKELLTWRTVDAELAALTYDSLFDDEVRSRAPGQPRIVTFEVDPVTIEVEVDATPGRRRLLGQVVPPAPLRLVLRMASGEESTTTADELGRFVLPLGPEPLRVTLRATLVDETVVETETVLL